MKPPLGGLGVKSDFFNIPNIIAPNFTIIIQLSLLILHVIHYQTPWVDGYALGNLGLEIKNGF
jgi:hypothetical protein